MLRNHLQKHQNSYTISQNISRCKVINNYVNVNIIYHIFLNTYWHY